MKFRTKPTVIALYAAMITGCATPGTSNLSYAPPQTSTKIQNEVIVSKPFEAVWDSFVRELAKSFYVINNIDKQSRIINVSFSTDTAEAYIDCGIVTRTYSRGDERQTSDSRRRRMLLKINDLPHMTFVNIKSIESTTYVFYAASNATSFELTY